MAKRNPRPALLVRVLTEIGSGRIWEVYLQHDKLYIDGETDGKSIRINPAPALVDTLIHETLHRLEPGWSERYVRRTTSWLLKRMSDEQIEQLYAEYQRIAIKKKRRERREH